MDGWVKKSLINTPLKRFIECPAGRETITLEIGDRKIGTVNLRAISTEMTIVVIELN